MNQHWITTVGDAFEFVRNGKSVKQEPGAGGLPVTRIETIADGSIDERRVGYAGLTLKGNEQWLLQPGDILFSHINSVQHVGKSAIYEGRPEALLHGMNLLALRPGRLLHPRFALYALRQPTFRAQLLQFVNKAVNQASVSTTNLKSLPFPLPPLDEQRRIATILDKADALRQKRKRAIALLDSLTYARPAASTTRADSSVGIEDVADLQIGYPFKSDGYTTDLDAVRLCRGANVLPGTLDWSDLAKWPTSGTQPYGQYALQSGDIIVAMDRPWIGAGFKIAQVQPKDLPALLVQRVARIRAKDARDATYLFSILRGPDFTKHCKPTETTIPHISPKDFRSFRFGWPSDAVRESLASQTDAENKVRDGMQASASMLEAMFSSLQHRAFSGQL